MIEFWEIAYQCRTQWARELTALSPKSFWCQSEINGLRCLSPWGLCCHKWFSIWHHPKNNSVCIFLAKFFHQIACLWSLKWIWTTLRQKIPSYNKRLVRNASTKTFYWWILDILDKLYFRLYHLSSVSSVFTSFISSFMKYKMRLFKSCGTILPCTMTVTMRAIENNYYINK